LARTVGDGFTAGDALEELAPTEPAGVGAAITCSSSEPPGPRVVPLAGRVRSDTPSVVAAFAVEESTAATGATTVLVSVRTGAAMVDAVV
jgi:hypothetical protein